MGRAQDQSPIAPLVERARARMAESNIDATARPYPERAAAPAKPRMRGVIAYLLSLEPVEVR